RGPADECHGRPPGAANGSRQAACGLNAALEDPLLLGRRPPPRPDRLAREVDDSGARDLGGPGPALIGGVPLDESNEILSVALSGIPSAVPREHDNFSAV